MSCKAYINVHSRVCPNLLAHPGHMSCCSCCGLNRAFVNFVDSSHSSSGYLLLECDEYQHLRAGYSIQGDLAWMVNVHRSLTIYRQQHRLPPGRIVFVRFNPDYFTVNGQTVNVRISDRHAALFLKVKELQLELAAVDQPQESFTSLEVHYMYYNALTLPNRKLGPSCTQHNDFDNTLLDMKKVMTIVITYHPQSQA